MWKENGVMAVMNSEAIFCFSLEEAKVAELADWLKESLIENC